MQETQQVVERHSFSYGNYPEQLLHWRYDDGGKTMAAKYQVFISSTYEDLRKERDQVIRAVLEMGHIPVGMEMFSAADEEQWQIIAKHIEESDYYAVIAAHRVGSMAADGISYTRKEYEYAVEKGIPVLGFVIDDKASWPSHRVETGTGAKKALDDFKTLIREKPVNFWTNADDLHGKFSVSLMKAITTRPREGWIRASTANGGPGVTAEVVRLSAENASLREQLKQAKAASEREHLDELQQTVNILFETEKTPSYRYTPHGEWKTDSTKSLFMMFQYLAPDMIIEASVSDIASTLAMHVRKDRESATWDIVAMNQVRAILADFMTLDLVQPSTKRHPLSDKEEYWSLTANGNAVLKRIRRVTLSDSKEQDAPVDVEETADNKADRASQADKATISAESKE